MSPGRRVFGTILVVWGLVQSAIGVAGVVWPAAEVVQEAVGTTDEREEAASPSPEAEPEGPTKKDVRAFVADLFGAIQRGDAASLFDALDRRVIDRYGAKACRAQTRQLHDPTASARVLKVDDPAPWDWEIDETSTTIPDAYEVTIRRSSQGASAKVDIHIGSRMGLGWFTDCGEPRS